MVVSKDSDFRQLAFLFGPPPKVMWLRVGNASTARVPFRCSSTTSKPSRPFRSVNDEALLVLPAMST